MRYTLLDNYRDEGLLFARVLMVVLFVVFGWMKLTGFSATVAEMTAVGLPVPMVAAVVSIIMEFFVGMAIVVGFFTRPLALLLAVYTVATALIAHRYWQMTGPAQLANMINFYKNFSITAGLLLLAVTGPGKYSVDRK